ncbi:MAG: M14 family metallopeptidase, partial [Proteobacteria bacterium]|nr:M14 family metallopeptidase [Pseudomonadota bacterium]
MSADSHFARDYTGAREKFLAAAKPHATRYRAFQNPLRGPRGEPLF